MKNIFILLLSVFCGHILSAQSANRAAITNKHHEVVRQLLQQHVDNAKSMRTTTGITEDRVIAQSTRDSTGVTLTDSISLFYAPNMGSTYDFNDMDYPYNYPYSASPMFNYAGVFTTPQVLYDTCIHWTDNPFTLAYGLYESTYAGYDANRNLVNFKDIFTDSTINTNMSYINHFTASNKIDSGSWFRLSAGMADSAFAQYFSYNISGLLTKDSIYEYHLGVWHLVARTLYTYDVSNNLTLINYYANDTDTSFTQPLIEKERYINTYDASNRLLTVLNSTYNGTALDSNLVDTFAYTGVYTYHTSWKEYQYDPINHYWAPMFNMSKIINGGGLPDTVNVDGFDSILNAWIPQTRYTAAYNSFNLPDTLREYDYNFTTFPTNPSFTTVYYYQTYVNSTATNSVKALVDNINIYPNPATDMITISQSGVLEKGMMSVSIININGQVISRQHMPAQDQIQMSIKSLLPGIYYVVLQDEKGTILYKQTIVKTHNP